MLRYCKTGIIGVVLASFTLIPKVVQKISLEELDGRTLLANDTLYIVNYWATWCRPCVAEMPYFWEAAKRNAKQKVKIVFVSLNSVKEMGKVQQFADTKKIEQDVFVLNESNPNVWINKVDSGWSGSIPATVMYRKKEKVFFREGEFIQAELDSIINLNLK